MNHVEDIFEVLRSGYVERYHAVPFFNGSQTTGVHAWGVAQILLFIAPELSLNALKAALWHDCAEIYTSDVPSPVKVRHPELAATLQELENDWLDERNMKLSLTDEEEYLLLLADRLEGLWYAGMRYNLGESAALEVFNNYAYCILQNTNNPARPMPDRAWVLFQRITDAMTRTKRY